jgi:hypothetical protein
LKAVYSFLLFMHCVWQYNYIYVGLNFNMKNVYMQFLTTIKLSF